MSTPEMPASQKPKKPPACDACKASSSRTVPSPTSGNSLPSGSGEKSDLHNHAYSPGKTTGESPAGYFFVVHVAAANSSTIATVTFSTRAASLQNPFRLSRTYL
ncbi:hypothetical protein MVEN_01815100 [Mycena venus]|uniref:Uncharacterized protein n=1 Tax=Mycena venus TaxID=2733690 RepID=A0A8H6XIR0_9AGAR|nr:hypothetical protein MVEN_01815100 [Mycena venus]